MSTADAPPPENLETLEGEVRILTLIRQFTDRALQVNWFSQLGEPLSEATQNDARHFMHALGFPDAQIALLASWEDAANACETTNINAEAWEAEEQLRAAALTQTLQAVSQEGLGVLLTHLSSALVESVENALTEAFYYADMDEQNADICAKLALGCAQQACHGAALAIAAAAVTEEETAEKTEQNHPLILRFQLFEQGRWPVSLVGQSFNLF